MTMESYEEDDLFRDLYGDDEAEVSLSKLKKDGKIEEKPKNKDLEEIKKEFDSEISKVGLKSDDLSCNIEEEGSGSLFEDEKDISRSFSVKNEDIPKRDEERVDLKEEEEVLCIENEDISKSVEQTVSEVTGSTIREDGKMFIGGLNWETTDESLRAYFEQFGEVTECSVMRDSSTFRSRGFGFLTFKDPKCVNTVMVKEHYLDGKIIDPKRAIPREEQEKTAKMFVGGVSQDCTEEEFKEFFSAFGRVIDATLMIDKDTGRPRGFGFVTFESEAAVENAMAQPYLVIHDKQVEVKRATPKGNLKERTNMTKEKDMNGYDYQRNYFGKDNSGFNFPMDFQSMQQFYGGMSPAIVAQYYQRMQAYIAAMQNMGRGMQIPGGMGRGMMPGIPGFPMGMNMGPMNPMMMNQMNNMMSNMVNFNNTNLPSQSTPQITVPTSNQEIYQVSDDGNINTKKDIQEKDIVQKTDIKTSTTNTTVTPSIQPSRPTPPPNAPTGPSKSASSSRNHRTGYSRNGRGHSFHPYQRRNQ
ncbi:hypothetical protein PNEG_00959 [Pneumocystis murina B123]|uniref:RRM domain-containing protein n=1 Tax=Pneumocystis murina (strain B123) TaxID=1069680 RepID=M7NU60_PNEMU|nr:hypothetical protein PNEG_00959 [Pneumocystis murina B123]EMR10812.1 hypothetical protein PNEG_00959 [Pneumocystis murina B123]